MKYEPWKVGLHWTVRTDDGADLGSVSTSTGPDGSGYRAVVRPPHFTDLGIFPTLEAAGEALLRQEGAAA